MLVWCLVLGSEPIVLIRPKFTAHDWARKYSDLEAKKAHLDASQGSGETPVEFMLVCKYCCLGISPDPAEKPSDRIREHVTSARQDKVKTDFEKAEQVKMKQRTTFQLS